MIFRLKTRDAATYAGISESLLEKLRGRGDGPEYLKVGRAVIYDRAAIDQWLAGCARRSTSQAA